MVNSKAVCGSCHAPADSYGASWKNSKRQHLTKIRPHWKAGEVGGTMCNARIGVVAK